MQLGPLRISHPFALAPMEEHTNPPFRQLMRQLGAGLLCTERIDGSDVAKRDRRAMRLLETAPGESPCAGQISGVDPAEFIRANANRAGYFHFKDGEKRIDAAGKSYPHFTELGRGEVDLKAAMAAALEVGASWITSEQDQTEIEPAESAALSRRYMRDTLGV